MKRIPVLLRKFAALSPVERRTLLAAAACMPLFWAGLRLVGLARFRARLQGAGRPEQPPLSVDQIQRVGELVNIAARHTLGPSSCLTRSLVLGWFLQRRGVESALRIGVQLRDGSLAAHAWIECHGIPINDRLEVGTQFAAFSELIPFSAFDGS